MKDDFNVEDINWHNGLGDVESARRLGICIEPPALELDRYDIAKEKITPKSKEDIQRDIDNYIHYELPHLHGDS